MKGLLDNLFDNLEERNLNSSQIETYIRYLEELIAGGLSIEQELAYQGIKLKLTKRLHDLNKQRIQFYQQNKADKGEKEDG